MTLRLRKKFTTVWPTLSAAVGEDLVQDGTGTGRLAPDGDVRRVAAKLADVLRSGSSPGKKPPTLVRSTPVCWTRYVGGSADALKT
jgi:hypothetical protein